MRRDQGTFEVDADFIRTEARKGMRTFLRPLTLTARAVRAVGRHALAVARGTTPHRTIWREGDVHRVVRTRSTSRTVFEIARHTLDNLLAPKSARRVRIATCDAGYADPIRVEARLRRIGAIAPPGGWPAEARIDDGETGEGHDVRVRTLSVMLVDMSDIARGIDAW